MKRLLIAALLCAGGAAIAQASPMTPYPQPRSRIRPPAGGSVSRKSTDVPMSSRPWAKTPEPLTRLSRCPQTSASTGARWNATAGSAEK